VSNEENIVLRKKIAEAIVKARKIVAVHKAEYKNVYTASGGGGTTQSNTSTTVPPQVLAEYQNVTNQANQVASAPLNQYQGQIVADTTPTEQSAYNTINNMQGISAPYTGAASNLVGQATQNINPNTVTASQIQNYESPYTQNVLNSTMAAENNQDAQQQAQLQGNAISSGAWGGDRAGVAQGILGGQQALANNATNAGILNQGYSQALQEANTQQQVGIGAQEASQNLQLSGGLAQNQIGTTAQNNALAGAQAQLGAGQQQQQQAQSILNVPYEQFLQSQAYPFQTTGWLGNIAEGIGSNTGGQSTSSTTQPSQGLFSDRRLKKNIHNAGILAGSKGDYPLHTFEYKGSNQRHSGVIAQEVEKKNPDAVFMDKSGYRKVDYSKLARGGIVKPHLATGGVSLPAFASGNPMTDNVPGVYDANASTSGLAGSQGNLYENTASGPAEWDNYNQTWLAPGTTGAGGLVYTAPVDSAATDAQNAVYGMTYGGPGATASTGASSGPPVFAAQTAPTYAQFAASNPNSGGIAAPSAAPSASSSTPQVSGINANNQADLDMIYGKGKSRGGIVPKHYDAGGGDIMSGISQVESGNNPDAVSPAGAFTEYGIMPATAADPGYGVTPYQGAGDAKRFATDYHNALLNHFGGDENTTLMAYNGGPGRLDKVASGDSSVSDLPQETQQYPGKVMAAMGAGDTSSMPPPTPPTNAQDHPANSKSPYEAEMPKDNQPNPWLSVAAGVLGTLAGRSRNPLVDIGQGGLIGLNNYAEQTAVANKQNYDEGSFHQNAQKLMDDTQLAQDKFKEEKTVDAANQANQVAERQKPIPDGWGGFIIPNPKDPAHPIPVSSGSSGSGSGNQSTANVYNPPVGADGKPLRGEAFLQTLPPNIAAQARLYVKGDAPPPTGFAAKPVLLAAQQAASIADPTWTGQRYSTIQDFTKGAQTAKTVQAQNVTMEHFGTLQDAVSALDNGNVPLFNSLAQGIARQTGSPVPTNFELGKTIVYDEMAKAILGSNSSLADRQAFTKNMDTGSSRAQAEGQLNEAGKYMAGQAYGLEQRYTSGSGLTDYRKRFMTPAARNLIEKYYPSDDKAGATPAATSSSTASAAPTSIIKYDTNGNRVQ